MSLQPLLSPVVGTCVACTHSVFAAHDGAAASATPPFSNDVPVLPSPMNASPVVHSAAPAIRRPSADRSPRATTLRSEPIANPPSFIARLPSCAHASLYDIATIS